MRQDFELKQQALICENIAIPEKNKSSRQNVKLRF